MSIATLDATADERHDLDPTRPHNRESLVWVVPLPEQELGVVAYTWVGGDDKAGALGLVFGPRLAEPVFERVDGIDVPRDRPFTDWEAGPFRSAHTEPLRKAEIAYAGQDVQMDFTFEAMHEPYGYATHAEGFPSFYADERYEQGGRARGTLTLHGEEIAFDAFCHRDHSWGARDWAAVTHYKWIDFLTPSASINVMDLQAYGRTWIRGYVFKDDTTAEILDARFEYDFDEDFFHHQLRVEFEDSAGRTTTAVMDRGPAGFARLQYPIHPRLQLLDIIGTAEIDGEAGVTYAEMAWPPEYIDDRKGLVRP